MPFIFEGKPVYRVYDLERELELGTGPGAHGHLTAYIHKIGDPDAFLGGGVEWEVATHNRTAEDLAKATLENPVVTNFLFKNPWKQRGGFVIDGYDRKETLNIISDAVIKSYEMTQGKYRGKNVFNVILASRFESWIKGE